MLAHPRIVRVASSFPAGRDRIGGKPEKGESTKETQTSGSESNSENTAHRAYAIFISPSSVEGSVEILETPQTCV